MKRTAVLSILLSVLLGCEPVDKAAHISETTPVPLSEWSNEDRVLWDAFQSGTSDLQVRGSGVVVKVLADDLEGAKHQKFILELGSGQTILIAHNIDLAPRLSGLKEGEVVGFYGEYEWNDKGGVVHWTHHDPAGRHVDGWLLYQGVSYSGLTKNTVVRSV